MSLRSDLIPVIDDARAMVADLGLRLHVVKVVTRTWSGSEVGRGTPSDVELTIDPAPKVRPPHPREVSAAQGRYENGDQLVQQISATYTRAELDGGTIAAGVVVFWTIDGEEYRLVGLSQKPFEWRAHLQRMRR